jgi:ion channel-forming bestrophin family protein
VGRIVGPVLTVSIFSAAVVYAHNMGIPVTLTNSVTPLLAVVVSDRVIEDVLRVVDGVWQH